MIRFDSRASSHAAQRARDELDAAWQRAGAAALALRGRRASHWPWLAAGLAAGVVIGATGAVLLRRAPDRQQAQQRAEAAVDTVRHRAGEVAQTAASTARDTAQRVRDRLGRDTSSEYQPAGYQPG